MHNERFTKGGGENMEKYDIYDINRIKTGRVNVRGSGIKLKEGEYRMVVHLCIINSKGEMLIQQRQADKAGWPNLWDVSVGGCSIAGENSRDAVTRELSEELGLKFDFENVRPKFTINFERGFDDWYVINMNVDLVNLKLQEEEVQDARFASREEIYRLIDESQFIHYHKSVIDMCFDMVGLEYGAFNSNDGKKI